MCGNGVSFMTKKQIALWCAAGVCLLAFAVLLILLLTVDVASVGTDGVRVGLSSLNGYFLEKCGVHDVWDAVTDVLMYAAFAVAVCFGALGLWQAMRRKSLRKVDRDLYLIFAVYVLTVGIYVLFVFVTVNTRPFLENGKAESSFPSSHVLCVAAVLGAGAVWCWHHVKSRVWRALIAALAAVWTAVVAAGRLLAGKHWFTDVLAALFLAAAFALAAAALCVPKKTE